MRSCKHSGLDLRAFEAAGPAPVKRPESAARRGPFRVPALLARPGLVSGPVALVLQHVGGDDVAPGAAEGCDDGRCHDEQHDRAEHCQFDPGHRFIYRYYLCSGDCHGVHGLGWRGWTPRIAITFSVTLHPGLRNNSVTLSGAFSLAECHDK